MSGSSHDPLTTGRHAPMSAFAALAALHESQSPAAAVYAGSDAADEDTATNMQLIEMLYDKPLRSCQFG